MEGYFIVWNRFAVDDAWMTFYFTLNKISVLGMIFVDTAILVSLYPST
jgi:hypothetical protein